MAIESMEPRPGMRVVDAAGAPFGEVIEVRPDDFLVHRQGQPDLYLLRSAVELVRDDEVVLRTTAEQIISLAWATPAIPHEPATGTIHDIPVPAAAPTAIPSANQSPADQIETGLAVLTADGQELGTVKAVEDGRFLIDRPRARDIWMPDRYVDHIGGGAVILRLDQAAVDASSWEHPRLI